MILKMFSKNANWGEKSKLEYLDCDLWPFVALTTGQWPVQKPFNSPGTIVQFLDIFPFWAKMKSVITASCDDFCKNFLSQSQVHEL